MMIKCDRCGERAIYNIQNTWSRWYIVYDEEDIEEYQNRKEWDGECSEFYCQKCYDKEMHI